MMNDFQQKNTEKPITKKKEQQHKTKIINKTQINYKVQKYWFCLIDCISLQREKKKKNR